MRRNAVSVLAIVSLALAPYVAEAKGRPQAKRAGSGDAKLDAAIATVEAKSYEKGAAELERVYAANKDPRALFWLGRALQGGGKHAAALRAYQRYVREAGASADTQRSVDVLGNVQMLSMQVGMLTVTAPEGCTIAVDGVEVGKAPLAEPFAVDAGSHTVSARCGETPSSRTVEVAEESRIPVDFAAPDKSAPAPAAAAAAASAEPAAAPSNAHAAGEPPRSPSSSRTTTTVIGLGAATLLAGGAVYFGVQAAKSSSDFEAKKQALGVDRDQLETLQKHTRLNAGLAAGLGVAAIGTAGLTLFVFRPSARSETRVGVSGQGLSLGGRF
jgi:hypothetical protein